jgi:hypothetical protein
MSRKINTLLQCNMDPNQGGLYRQDMRYAKEVTVSAEKLKERDQLYINVTVHRNRFPFNNQVNALIIQIYSVIKLYMFRASSLPIIRSFLLYIRHWYVSCTFLMTASKQSGWNCSSTLTLLGSGNQKRA